MILSNAARVCAIALSIGAAPVAKASTISLLVAAGGGGGAVLFGAPLGPGLITESGGTGDAPNDGPGGAAGLGGGAGSPFDIGGGGGGGWLGPGGSAATGGGGGQSFPTFAGGTAGPEIDGAATAAGGFGGGGGGGPGGGGGGGGYSGGGGGGVLDVGLTVAQDGGGGGSYVAPALTNVLASPGYNGNFDNVDAPGYLANNGYVIVGFQVFNYTGSVVQFTIPTTGDWWVAAVGAQGGADLVPFGENGGLGAAVGGDIFLPEGTVLDILVGGGGISVAGGSGGGGGSFVWDPAPLPQQPVPTPEPSTWTMMLLGLAGLGFAGYRRARVGRATLSAGAFTASR
jgi:hypothetical protein